MQFAIVVFVAALALAVDTMGFGDVIIEDSIMKSPMIQDSRPRLKRSIGVSKDVNREIEIKSKFGGSIKVSKSVSYNDGGILSMLPAVLDSATNNRIRILNQLQNGRGRPGLAASQINGASSSADFSSDDDFSADTAGVSSAQAAASEPTNTDVGNSYPESPTTTTASASVQGDGVCCDSKPIVASPVVSRTVIVARPVVVNPIIAGGGVCCNQPKSRVFPVVRHRSRLHGLKELIAYKRGLAAQLLRKEMAVIHAIKAHK